MQPGIARRSGRQVDPELPAGVQQHIQHPVVVAPLAERVGVSHSASTNALEAGLVAANLATAFIAMRLGERSIESCLPSSINWLA